MEDDENEEGVVEKWEEEGRRGVTAEVREASEDDDEDVRKDDGVVEKRNRGVIEVEGVAFRLLHIDSDSGWKETKTKQTNPIGQTDKQRYIWYR